MLIEVLRLGDQQLAGHLARTDLDDVFLALTGRRADDEAIGDGRASRGGAA